MPNPDTHLPERTDGARTRGPAAAPVQGAADGRTGGAAHAVGHVRKPDSVRDRAIQALLTEPSLAAAAATLAAGPNSGEFVATSRAAAAINSETWAAEAARLLEEVPGEPR